MGKLKIIIASIIALNLLTSCDWHFGVNGPTPPKPPYNPMPVPASILDAAKYGDIEAAKQFLANGSNVNARNGQNRTPLHMAALIGYKEIVELLITNDADVNAKDNKGKTPMDAANVTNHTEIADLLRKHGGKQGAELPPATLHEAIIQDDLQGIKDFLAKGADVNARMRNGMTPLDWAKRRPEIADLLRKHGGKTNKELEAEGN